MKNFSFKVFPTQSGSENKQEPKQEPLQESLSLPEATEPDANQLPCSPELALPLSPPMPCPPFSSAPVPPQMPYSPMAPMMPCPPTGPMPNPISPEYTAPNYPAYAVPPFTCPYFRLAHAYVPWQNYSVVFNPTEALDKGTLFPELFMPQGNYGPCEGPQPCHLMVTQGGVPYGCM